MNDATASRPAAGDPIELLLESQPKDLGEFVVRRTLPAQTRQRVGPFIFFDHMGPAEFSPGTGVAVRPHPHIGLATLTYLFEGTIVHRDSLGHVQPIEPGAVNWMTAGSGIAHSERTPPGLVAQGSRVHGLQVWLALPLELEETDAHFEHYPAADIPGVDHDGVRGRLVAGAAFGATSPVVTTSDTLFASLDFQAGSRLEIADVAAERAVYTVAGTLRIGNRDVPTGTMAVLRPGETVPLEAAEQAKAVVLGGEPLAGERHLYWNFVSSSRERIEQAKRDWRGGRFGKVPGDDEFIPLPD